MFHLFMLNVDQVLVESTGVSGCLQQNCLKDHWCNPLRVHRMVFRHGSLLCKLLNKEEYQNNVRFVKGVGAFLHLIFSCLVTGIRPLRT